MAKTDRASSDRDREVRVDGKDQGRVIVRGTNDPTRALANQ